VRPAAHPAGPPALEVLAPARAELYGTFFGEQAAALAELCHAMAERFARGGRLVAFGAGPADRSDVRHVAVEFVHPVIVGKRALPALGLEPADAALLLEADDIAMAFGTGPEVERAVADAAARGCDTVAFTHVGARAELVPGTEDPFAAQEAAETAYHVLWELVHVFFEHRGLLAGRTAEPTHDPGASSFLYPFLTEREDDLGAVLADVRASVLLKAAEVCALREQTLGEHADVLRAAAVDVRAALDAGGRVLALGNGGSATDAMDAVADLPEDPAILTAIANDIGAEAVFARQVIAHGREGDVLLAISTSGGSANVLAALAEARRRGLATIALVGYDGGRIAAEGLADHVVVSRSEHIPRIQEAQATVLHALRGLIEA
jgi:D-sedoheptulose 7-phosphate isomerase